MKCINLCLTLFALLLVATAGFAQKPVVFNTDGKAIHGYDAVAYFTDSKSVKSDSTITYAYDGATWLFANAKNRDAFKADPVKYAPQ